MVHIFRADKLALGFTFGYLYKKKNRLIKINL